MRKHTFSKEERLKSHKEIGLLFGGKADSFAHYPLRLVWRLTDERRGPALVQFTVSVPKKKFKKAAHRNVLRRRVREAWRQNKYLLLDRLTPEHPQYAWIILYTGQEAFDYDEIEKSMRKIIHRFIKQQHL